MQAAPQPTYVSELGPATSVRPRDAGDLPNAGSGGDAPAFPSQAAGIALAAGGVALIYVSRALRPRPVP